MLIQNGDGVGGIVRIGWGLGYVVVLIIEDKIEDECAIYFEITIAANIYIYP